jgi:hypothetical protein
MSGYVCRGPGRADLFLTDLDDADFGDSRDRFAARSTLQVEFHVPIGSYDEEEKVRPSKVQGQTSVAEVGNVRLGLTLSRNISIQQFPVVAMSETRMLQGSQLRELRVKGRCTTRIECRA